MVSGFTLFYGVVLYGIILVRFFALTLRDIGLLCLLYSCVLSHLSVFGIIEKSTI